MKERSRERLASLLMEELVEQISQNERIRKMLGDMTSVPTEEVIDRLIEEFEAVVTQYHELSVDRSRSRRTRSPRIKDESFSTREIHKPDASLPDAESDPPPSEHSPVEPKSPRPSPATISGHEEEVHVRARGGSLRKRLEDIEQRLMARLAAKPSHAIDTAMDDEDLEKGNNGAQSEVLRLVEMSRRRRSAQDTIDVDGDTDAADVEEDSDAGAHDIAARTPYVFADGDSVYLHAVTHIPHGEEPADTPFMLEEKGIDGRGFAFALDHNDLRFYLSKTAPSMSVSKTGMLLLNQEDSIKMRSASENILNDLRSHGILLPFEFGTVMRSKDELYAKVDDYEDELDEAIEEEFETTTWTLVLSALDERIAKLVGTPASGGRRGRERTRESTSSHTSKKSYDLKVLEKILNREKRIAQTIHDELKKTADDCGIKSIVTLMSGSSADWKPILTAWYEVDPDDLHRFYNTIIELQYQNIMFDLMFSLSGNRGRFSFGKR